jgi:tetratricopeptide (TPR) repeat protein
MRLRALVPLLLLVAACGGPGEGYFRAKTAGDRAKTSGRYDEAARAYEQAAAAAKTPHERDEAAYLAASTWVQAGRTDEAMRSLDRLVANSPHGERSDRAAFDRAFLEIDRGDEAKGWDMLEKAMLDRPAGGSSRRALRKLLEHAETQSKGSGLAWLDARFDRLVKTELAEDAKYLRAGLLAAAGRNQEARDAYAACAREHPYPGGSLNDDAWWHAAELDVTMGQPQKAIDDLHALLAPRETSTLGQGSYERPKYSPAQMKIAEIYRDVLKDERSARRELHKLVTDHPTAVIRAEALFEETRLAKKAGDRDDACRLAERLAKDFEDSRYAGCAPVLCDTVKAPAKTPSCRQYLRARITGEPTTLEPPTPGSD